MARDYAQRRGNGRKGKGRTPKHAARQGTPGWIWMLLGIAIGVVAAAGFWIMRPPGGPAPERVAAPPLPAEQADDDRIELPPEKPSRFSFYEILPDYEVVIPRDEPPRPRRDDPRREAAPPPPPAEPPPLPAEGRYVIQVASFRSRSDAEAQRAELALIGLEARVETVTVDDRQTWYRVRVGPFGDAARAHSAMVRLQEHGHNDVMLMRVRG